MLLTSLVLFGGLHLDLGKCCAWSGKKRGRCSYNAVNGVPSCANPWLLQEVARDAWGFDGYITSDCDADNDVFYSHHYGKSPEEAVADIFKAGTDVDCGGFMSQHVQSALDKGTIAMDDVDARLRYLTRFSMHLRVFQVGLSVLYGISGVSSK